MNPSRRIFAIQSLTLLGASTAIHQAANAQTPSNLSETDAQAVALGYKTDTTQVDAKKHTNHSTKQSCGGCALFQGKAADASAPCLVFGNKVVVAKGWCSAWTKKA